MAEKLNEKIKWEYKFYRDYLKNGKAEAHYIYLHHAINEVSQLISESEDEYYNKLRMQLYNPKLFLKPIGLSLKHFIMVEKYQ